jgi:tripartite-type tricarboxylate transporter receptor subunit TctC
VTIFKLICRSAAVAAVLLSVPASAQQWPQRPVTVLIGQPGGTGPDIMVRLYGEVIAKNTGQRIVVDNRTGAGGIVAAQALTQAAPDGHTLMVALGGLHTVIPAMQKMPFDAINDFTFPTMYYSSSNMLLVPADSPVKSYADFAAAMKAKGGGVSYATPGIGSPAHLMSSVLQDKLGIQLTHIPYRGGSQILMDLLASRFDFTFVSSVQAKPFIADGRVRPLMVAGNKRIAWAPDVPTMPELGLADMMMESLFAIAGPKDLPDAIALRIYEEFAKASEDPMIIKRAAEESVIIRTGGPRDEARTLFARDAERLGAIVRKYGIKTE